jgi:antitoxin HigA-1
MDNRLNIIKGISPGKLLARDLKRNHLTQRDLSRETGIPYQTINAFIMGRRKLTLEQALKIEPVLDYEEGFLSMLQLHYDIREHREKEYKKQFVKRPHIRRSLFWDADFDKINWAKYKKAVIRRVIERGNTKEKDEIRRFYHLSVNDLEQYESEKLYRR